MRYICICSILLPFLGFWRNVINKRNIYPFPVGLYSLRQGFWLSLDPSPHFASDLRIAMMRNQLEVPASGMYKTTTRGTTATAKSARSSKSSRSNKLKSTRSGTSTASAKKSGVRGFFSKLKQAIVGYSSESEEEGAGLGPVTSRRHSRRSSHREAREAIEAERLREERKSKCVAITVAKRDPLAVQRLLVDCEFCNPPPKFGVTLQIPSADFTSADAVSGLHQIEKMEDEHKDLSDERQYNVGLVEWLRVRDWWLTPTADAQSPHFLEADLTADKYYTVYDKMIYHTRPLKHPLCLADTIKIVKAGWVAEGTWPNEDDDDVWSTTDPEETGDKQTDAEKTQESNTNDNNNANNNPKTPVPKIQMEEKSSESDQTDSHVNNDEPRVQFDNIPVPKRDGAADTLPLERLLSGTGTSLRPVRSAQSSVVSITDSE